MFDNLLEATKKKIQSLTSGATSVFNETVQDVREIGRDINKSVERRGASFQSVFDDPTRSNLEKGFRLPIEAVTLGSDITSDVFKGVVKTALDPATEQKLSKAIQGTVTAVAENPTVKKVTQFGQEQYNKLPKNVQDPLSTVGLLALGVADWASKGRASEVRDRLLKELVKETDEQVIKETLDTVIRNSDNINIKKIAEAKDIKVIRKEIEDANQDLITRQILAPEDVKARAEIRSIVPDKTVAQTLIKDLEANPKNRTALLENIRNEYKIKAPELQKVVDDVPNPVFEEARKYKTAEEFVKAQGTPVYHGSDVANIIEKEGFKKMPIRTGVPAFGDGSYFASKRGDAKGYGDVVKAFLQKDIKLKTVLNSDAYQVDTKKLIDEGYDGTILATGNGNNIVIFDQTKVKTKSQLEDIWKQANETKPVRDESPLPKEDTTDFSKDKSSNLQEVRERQLPNEFYEKNRSVSQNPVKEKVKDATSAIARGSGELFTPAHSLLKDLAPQVANRLRRFEFDVGNKQQIRLKAVEPLLKKVRKMSKEDISDFDLARKNGDDTKIQELVKKYGLAEEYKAYRKTLDDIYVEAEKLGIPLGYLKNYSPRIIKNPKKFLEYMYGKDTLGLIDEAIAKKAEMTGRDIASFTVDEKAQIANTLIRGYKTGNVTLSRPANTKERMVDVIDKDLNQFYASSDTALLGYIRAMTENIEARKFFGTELKLANSNADKITKLSENIAKRENAIKGWQKEIDDIENLERGSRGEKMIETRKKYIQEAEDINAILKEQKKTLEQTAEKLRTDTKIEDSIGGYIVKGLADGSIPLGKETEISDILKSRFNTRTTAQVVSAYKNMEYISTMGSTISAITQLGDLGVSMYKAGLGSTLKSAISKKNLTREDIGVEKIAQEFSEGSSTAKAVDLVFKATGLNRLDKFGKETLINASIDRVANKIKTADKETMDKIQEVFGDEAEQFIKDVKDGNLSENVKYWAYNDLADVAPINLSEMPRGYLDNPNGRVFYMLKTYTVKLLDIYRRDVYKEIAKGNVKQGVENAIRLVAYLSLMNATAQEVKDQLKSAITGEEGEDTLSDKTVESILKSVGLNTYNLDVAKREGIGSAALKYILPPVSLFDSVTKDVGNAFSKDKDGNPKIDAPGDIRSIERIPLIGKFAYWWLKENASEPAESTTRTRKLKVRKPRVRKPIK